MNQKENSNGRSFNPILQTKLHRPQLPPDLVNRDRLIEVMNRAQEVPLTLVSAPAGYGKSVLAAQWCEQLDCPTAWLSLDADDSDLWTFIEYFLAALDDVVPDACKATRELLEAAPALPVPVVANYLLNDLDAMDTPCTMVLDDYHRDGFIAGDRNTCNCPLRIRRPARSARTPRSRRCRRREPAAPRMANHHTFAAQSRSGQASPQ